MLEIINQFFHIGHSQYQDQEDIFGTEIILINNLKNVFILPCMQPSWIFVDFDNWRDWENEEDEGKVEYDRYVDVSISVWELLIRALMCPTNLQYSIYFDKIHIIFKASFCVFIGLLCLLHLYSSVPDRLFRWFEKWQRTIKEPHQIWEILVM